MKKAHILLLIFVLFLSACTVKDTRKNTFLEYLKGAELQIETVDQALELQRALNDLLKLPCNEINQKTYANYQMEPNKWSLQRIIRAYYVPSKPISIEPHSFCTDSKKKNSVSEIKQRINEIIQLQKQ